MKNKTRFITLAAIAVLSASAARSEAQYRAEDDNGIVASPKVREMLDQQKRLCVCQDGEFTATTIRSDRQVVRADGQIIRSDEPTVRYDRQTVTTDGRIPRDDGQGRSVRIEEPTPPSVTTTTTTTSEYVTPVLVTTIPCRTGYSAEGEDGITASPKVRAMLDEQRRCIEMRPVTVYFDNTPR